MITKITGTLSRVLDDNQTSADKKAETVRNQTSLIGETLGQIIALLQGYLAEVTEIHAAVGKLAPKVGAWIDLGAIILTAVLLWIALGQLCLLALGWKWLRGPSRSAVPATP